MLSFQDLYESYATDVYRFALWLAGNRFDAEDITSETFIRAWVHNNPIRTETLKAYLFTIARNVYLGKQRKRKNEVAFEDIHLSTAPGPDEMVENQLDITRVKKVLQSVQETDRAAFILRVQYELAYAEIARVLGLSLTAAKVKVHRVRKKLLAIFIAQEVH